MDYTPEQRALRADALLKDPILSEAFQRLEAAYVLAFRKCALNDDRGRARYQDALNDIDVLKSHLMTVVAEGKLADHAAQGLRAANPIQKITRLF